MTNVLAPGAGNRNVDGVLLGRVSTYVYAPLKNTDIHFVRKTHNGVWVIRIGEVESVPFRRLTDAVNEAKSLFDI